MSYGENEIEGVALAVEQPLKVKLGSVGNPDFGQNPDRPLPGVRDLVAEVGSLAEAAAECRKFIDEHGLGGGNWAGGEVLDLAGNAIARVSYNGRVWASPGEPELSFLEAELVKHPEIHIDQAKDGLWHFRHDDNEEPPDDEYWTHGTYGSRGAAIRGAFEEYDIEIHADRAHPPPRG